MNLMRSSFSIVLLAITVLVFAGCGKKRSADGHDSSTENAEKNDDGHGHGEEAAGGASFKEGKGVILIEETRKSIGVEIADVTERTLPKQIPLTIQVFGEKHHHPLNAEIHTGCDVHGSAFVPEETATVVKAGQSVQVLRPDSGSLTGVVLSVQKALALGESEIIVGVSNAVTVLKPGEFAPAHIELSRSDTVVTIPQSALLRTAEGTFVYAINGDAFFRTAVKIGANAEGWIEITDGLLAGDQVAIKAVQTLYLIELRATKGGGHSH